MNELVKKNYYRFVFANFITNVGTGASFIIIGKYSYDRFNVASIFGGILLLEFLFGLVLNGKAGGLVDRKDAKKIAYISDFLLFLFGAFFSYFAFIGLTEITIIGFSVVLYLIKPFQNTSLFAVTKEFSDEKSLFKFNSHLGVAYQFGYLIGILSAGVIVDRFSPGYVFLLDSLTFLISGALIYICTPIPQEHVKVAKEGTRLSIAKEFFDHYNKFKSLLKSNKGIVVLSCIVAFQINLIVAYNTSLFKLVSDRSDDSFDLSLLESTYTVASLILSYLVGQYYFFRLNLTKVWLAFFVQAIVMWSFGIKSFYSYLPISTVIFGCISSLVFPAAITRLHQSTPSNLLGQVGASKNIINSFFALPVVSINAIVLDTMGLESSYLFLAALNVFMAILFFRFSFFNDNH